MLRRIGSLKDAGFFKDFRWSPGCSDFARINVIYGPNGSGKSCLARAFDAACSDPTNRACFALTAAKDGAERACALDDEIFDRIYVFDDEYVSRNHRFHEDDPDMQAILTIGERSAETEDKLAQLRQEVVEANTAIGSLDDQMPGLTKKREKLLVRISEAVVGDLTRLGGSYQSRSHYSVKVVDDKLRGSRDGWKTLGAKDLAHDREIVNAPKQEPVGFADKDVSISQELVAECERVLAASAASVVLDTLEKHPSASQWVQEGRRLHGELDNCIFCGSPLTKERKEQIDRHFSREVEELQEAVRAAISNLEERTLAIEGNLASLQPKSAVYVDLRKEYEDATQDYRARATGVLDWIAELRQRLESKLTNVLKPAEDAGVALPLVLPDSNAIVRIVKQHDDRAASHDAHVNEAAARIEKHHLSETAPEISEVDKTLLEMQSQLQSARSRLDSAKTEIAALENVEGDPTPSAAVLTREVARLLGRNELTFETEGARYRVLRDGEPAIGLSEGERTAMTLLHFMETVACHKDRSRPPIVIIDDPVSSLDSSVFMGISTYIWSECVTKKRAAQLVLLTHNFELFRQWDIQLEGLDRSKSKKEFPSRLYQLTTCYRTKNGVTVRHPVLNEWPPPGVSRKKARSSYVHAFIALAEAKLGLDESASLERLLDAQLLFPNVMRRFLEGFIGFKRPELAGNFEGAMRMCGPLLASAGYEGDAEALRLRLTRFAHAYSHSENPDTTVTIDPNEIVPALAAVFEFIGAMDSEHLHGLCDVANISFESLLPTAIAASASVSPGTAPEVETIQQV